MGRLSFHSRTQSLLARDLRPDRSVARLDERAEMEGFSIPASFREWAAFGGASICQRFSNSDNFSDLEAKLFTLEAGKRGLSFATESQGNFDLVCLLDGTDDPPVLFGWLGQEPWVKYAETFSDAIFCQVFDWQYKLDFRGDVPEIAYDSCFLLDSEGSIDSLAEKNDTLPSLRFEIEGVSYLSRRFALNHSTRAVTEESPGSYSVTVTGTTQQAVDESEDALLTALAGKIRPPTHTAALFGLLELGRHLELERSNVKLRSLFDIPPREESLDQLRSFCRQTSLDRLRTPEWNDDHERRFVVTIETLGLTITLAQRGEYQWTLESLA